MPQSVSDNSNSGLRASTTGYMPQLDGLRAFAVGAIMWHHWAPDHYHFGVPWSAGVQLFFVLSGFLITGILLDARSYRESCGERLGRVFTSFYVRRALRIFPLYYAVLFAASLAGISSLPETLPWHLFYLSNFSFYFHSGWGTEIGHFWTLAVEEQFYLFWPLLVLLVPRRHLFLLFSLVFLLGPFYRVAGSFISPLGVFAIGTPGSFDSLAGGALAALILRGEAPGLRFFNWRPWCVAGISVFLWFLFAKTEMFPIPCRQLGLTFLSVAFAALIGQAARGFGGRVGRLLTLPPLLYIGKISYGLYLFHNFASLPTRWILENHPILTQVPGNWILCNLILTLAAGSMSWHFFEEPINRLKRHFPYQRIRNSGKESCEVEGP
jgi:peptidoglycan/LPS O-acetylase OafA/YrhL